MRFLPALLICAALGAGVPGPELPPLERLQDEAMAYVQSQAAALPGTYTFRVVRPPFLPTPATPGQITFQPDHLSRRDLDGFFFASFKLFVDGRPLGLVRVDLEGKWTGRLLRAQTGLPRKQVPTADQLEAFDFQGTPPAGALSEFPGGYRLRYPVPSGHILTMQDLEPIPVVVAGDRVRLEVVSGPLVIAVEALARTSGAVGDKVRLEMPASHKNVQAVVSAPGEARVQWAGEN